MDYSEIYKKINQTKKSLIISHYNPDGDSIGSSLGLFHFLKQIGHDVNIIIPNESPDFLNWLPGSENIIIYNKNNHDKELIKQSEIAFFIDFNSIDRLEEMKDEFNNYLNPKVLIDHHPDPETFADFTISNTNVSSAAEIVFEFITGYSKNKILNKEIAECLYTGIMTDTVNFHHNVSSKTFGILSILVQQGIDTEKINSNVYDYFSKNRMNLLGYALNKKMIVLDKYNTAFIYLKNNELKKYNFQVGDSEGFVNYPLSIKNIKFSALFIERNDHIKISFRSKGNFFVNKFAEKHFLGGGHKNAAGGKSYDSLKITIKKFINLLSEYKDEFY